VAMEKAGITKNLIPFLSWTFGIYATAESSACSR